MNYNQSSEDGEKSEKTLLLQGLIYTVDMYVRRHNCRQTFYCLNSNIDFLLRIKDFLRDVETMTSLMPGSRF